MTKPAHHLKNMLSRIDGKGYKAYKDIQGVYAFERFTLLIDHVQGDPFAQPSRLRIRVDRDKSGFGPHLTQSASRTTAFSDWLIRRFAKAAKRIAKGSRGSGKGGTILIDTPGQQILERTAMRVTDAFIEARFFLGLPAFGRRIAGRDASEMLMKELPEITKLALFCNRKNQKESDGLLRHITGFEDAEALRRQLKEKKLVAFVGNGASLARSSGIDPAPLTQGAVLFEPPETLAVTLDRPNGGPITGMGIPEGVTLIAGGGFHGKSTLLNALELGVYNHIPDDGRQWVITRNDALKIRAADGRSISGVDISSFINNLPLKRSTTSFSTENASGSTSQAAAICEGLEAGARLLLLDEDTSATNFMIRDEKMQQLVSQEKEPITPFIHRVRDLYKEKGVSTILVMGGSGDYFSASDLVLRMTDYRAEEVTEKAHTIARNTPQKKEIATLSPLPLIHHRAPLPQSIPMEERRGRVKVATYGLHEMVLGKTRIGFDDVEQLTCPSQTRALAEAVRLAAGLMNGKRRLEEILDAIEEILEKEGLEALTDILRGDLASFRRLELAAVINRARSLKVL
ncbi:MAG: ABC-ATPase domain-containing protein [Desulfobacterales bacterium]|nr:ABC-ATPase domain-containing protein [Desulfobacterales bacterium]